MKTYVFHPMLLLLSILRFQISYLHGNKSKTIKKLDVSCEKAGRYYQIALKQRITFIENKNCNSCKKTKSLDLVR